MFQVLWALKVFRNFNFLKSGSRRGTLNCEVLGRIGVIRECALKKLESDLLEEERGLTEEEREARGLSLGSYGGLFGWRRFRGAKSLGLFG